MIAGHGYRARSAVLGASRTGRYQRAGRTEPGVMAGMPP